MKNKENLPSKNSFSFAYLAGFFIAVFLPIITIPPWFYPADWGKTIVFRSVIAILSCLFIYQFIYKKHELKLPSLKHNKIFWMLAALFFAFVLATIFSVDRYFSLWGSPARSGGVVNFTAYIVFGLLAFFILNKRQWKQLWDVAIGTGILVCLVAVIQFYGLFSNIFIPVNRPPSTLGNPDFLAMYLMLLFFLAVYFFITEKLRTKKIYYGLVCLLFVYTVLLSGSRAVFLGLAVGAVYLVITYPKKIIAVKTVAALLLLVALFGVYYANTHTSLPGFLENNKIANSVYKRLSINAFLNDARFYSWQIAFQAFKDKPVLGFGPENFAVGFDKHYDPSLPYIGNASSDWWDRAHNIFFDIAVQTGLVGVVAYFGLFAVLWWQLEMLKRRSENTEDGQHMKLQADILQTTFVAYLVANIFSFDNFSSYLLFFLLVGYTLHLVCQAAPKESPGFTAPAWIRNHRDITIAVLAIVCGAFLWQYNFWPMMVNAKVNTAETMSLAGQCDQATTLMETVMNEHSILDSRARLKYVEFMRDCAALHPEKNAAYAKRGIEVMNEAVKVQPLFSRLWIFMGGFETVQASLTQDPTQKAQFLAAADGYFQRAEELAPKHQELILEEAKYYMVKGDWQGMLAKSETCIALYPNVGSCYFAKAVAQLYSGDTVDGTNTLRMAADNGLDLHSMVSLNQLVNVYADTKNYDALADAYQDLIKNKPEVAQYHASLAFTWAQLKEYEKARNEAAIFLKLMPSAKDEVQAFLKTLPR